MDAGDILESGSEHPIPLVHKSTARIAQAAFQGSPYRTLRDKLGTVFADSDFADLYREQGELGYPPWWLALVTPIQKCCLEMSSYRKSGRTAGPSRSGAGAIATMAERKGR